MTAGRVADLNEPGSFHSVEAERVRQHEVHCWTSPEPVLVPFPPYSFQFLPPILAVKCPSRMIPGPHRIRAPLFLFACELRVCLFLSSEAGLRESAAAFLTPCFLSLSKGDHFS